MIEHLENMHRGRGLWNMGQVGLAQDIYYNSWLRLDESLKERFPSDVKKATQAEIEEVLAEKTGKDEESLGDELAPRHVIRPGEWLEKIGLEVERPLWVLIGAGVLLLLLVKR